MFSVMSLNLNGYNSKHGQWAERRELICEALRKKKPDVIALQAVRQAQDQHGGVDQAAQLASCMRGVSSMHFRPGTQTDDGLEGSAFAATVPESRFDSFPLSLSADCEDQNLRMVLRAFYETETQPVTVHNCHFSWVGEENVRNIQEALPILNESISSFSIIMGDFNAPPGTPGIKLLERQGWVDGWRLSHGEEGGLTFESNSPEIRIDYAFLSPSLARHSTTIEIINRESADRTVRMSDHLGLLIAVEV